MQTKISRAMFDQLMVPAYAPADFIPVRGQGSLIWDQNGKEYIDFAAGIAVTCLGHNHPKLIQALIEQAQKICHVSNLFTNEPALSLAKQLTSATFAERVFFTNSGAEANEAAFKLARKYAKDNFSAEKTLILSCKNSFHGRTLFTVSVGGQSKYQQGFAPLPEQIKYFAFNDISTLEQSINAQTCAVVIEPIQGEGGVLPASKKFLQAARELCDQNNALLIFDEVQTGIGRCASLFAYMRYGVVPDILTSAKGLGGGFPIGAMLTSAEIAASFTPGTHGSTYGGNPLACAVANKVMEIVNQKETFIGVEQRHQNLMQGLSTLNKKHNIFQDLRGIGLLIGAELSTAYAGQANKLVNIAAKHGLLLLTAGTNVIRIAPSLIIGANEIEQGLQNLDLALANFIQ